jgi:hypothetical protein
VAQALRRGDDGEIEWAAWNDHRVPEIERMKQEFLPPGKVYEDPNRSVPRASGWERG